MAVATGALALVLGGLVKFCVQGAANVRQPPAQDEVAPGAPLRVREEPPQVSGLPRTETPDDDDNDDDNDEDFADAASTLSAPDPPPAPAPAPSPPTKMRMRPPIRRVLDPFPPTPPLGLKIWRPRVMAFQRPLATSTPVQAVRPSMRRLDRPLLLPDKLV